MTRTFTRVKRLVPAAAALALAVSLTADTPSEQPVPEGDVLEVGFEGTSLEQWTSLGQRCELIIEGGVKHSGTQSLRMTCSHRESWADLMRRFPVERARGKKLRYAGYLKSQGISSGWGGLRLRVDGPNGIVAYDSMQFNGARGTSDWKRYETEVDIPADAVAIVFGAKLSGPGILWVDTLSLELDEPDPPPPLVTVHGIVRDPDGRPVSHAHVALFDSDTYVVPRRHLTGADGRFAFEIPAGEYRLSATARGFSAALSPVTQFTPETAAQPQTLALGREGVTFAGRVVDLAGRPLIGQWLSFFRESRPESARFYATTDEKGAFSVELIPHGPYRLEVASDDFITETVKLLGSADETVDLVAHPRDPARQGVVQWIREAASPLGTTSPGSGLDDLEPLRRMIGPARVVGLGEATHGSREFFDLRHRFFEYLVRELGFTVLAVESSWPESIAVDEYLLTGSGDPRLMLMTMRSSQIYNTEEVLDVMEWMRRYNADPAHERKLRYYGVDFHREPPMLVSQVSLYLERTAPELLAEFRLLASTGVRVGTLSPTQRQLLNRDFDRFLDHFDALRETMLARSTERGMTLARRLAVHIRQYLAWIDAELAGDRDAAKQARDEAMAANVRWILETEPAGTRVALWAHNGHVARGRILGVAPMGEHLARWLGEGYVCLGFAFNQGAFQALNWTEAPNRPGGLGRFELDPAPPEYLEAAFARAGLPIFVLDLRRRPVSGPVASWLAAPHPTREIGLHYAGPRSLSTHHTVTLTGLYDGVVFVDTTSRARHLGN